LTNQGTLGLDESVTKEVMRLEALHSYKILNTNDEESFDRFTKRVAHIFNVPIALISFVDEQRQWIKSRFGTDLIETPRCDAFCAHAIELDEVLVVPDALLDERFKENPLVCAEPKIRFYAGASLTTSDGFRLGTVCIIDTKPRSDFGTSDQEALQDVASSVMNELEFRKINLYSSFQDDVNEAVAKASDFKEALDTFLLKMGHQLAAEYCLVVQSLDNMDFYHFIAGAAINQDFSVILKERLEIAAIPLSEFSARTALTEGKIVDTGKIENVNVLGPFPIIRRLVVEGIKRQITIPIDLGGQRSAMIFGFKRVRISQRELNLIHKLIVRVTPLLKGRLRESTLQSERLRLDYVSRALRTLIGANQALAKAISEDALMETICKIAVTQGGYTAAWVGFAEHDLAKQIRVIAISGPELQKLYAYPLTWADSELGRGASGTAIREDHIVVMHNINQDARASPWRDFPETDKFGSCIAVPLRDADGVVFGVFTLYNAVRSQPPTIDQLSFNIEEQELLAGLARDMANGLTMIRDRKARDAAVANQRLIETRLSDLLVNSPTVVYALENDDPNWRISEVTPNFERIMGYPLEQGLNRGWWRRHVHPDDIDQTEYVIQRVLAGERVVRRYRVRHKSGEYLWIRDELELHPATTERPARIVGAWLDISEKQHAESEIHRLSSYDVLTRIPNRQFFLARLEDALSQSIQQGDIGGVIYIDLDGFKAINDFHGHLIGDQVLIRLSERIVSGVRSTDTVARFGADEFVVLLPKLGDESYSINELIEKIASKMSGLIERPIIIDDLSLHVTGSMGISLFPTQDQSAENIVRMADIAMHTAKKQTRKIGKNREKSNILLFTNAMQDTITRRHQVESELHLALANDGFELLLQRQVNNKMETIGAEALIRRRSAEGHLLAPDDFIQIAEESGLIVPIGQWVRSTACRFLAMIDPIQLPRISVNVSVAEFYQYNFVGHLLVELGKARVDPSRLTLEITESLLVEKKEETISILRDLAENRIRISIDDFGTGYSSLAYLQNMPINEIKIDKHFTHEMMINQRSAGLTQTIIALGHNFGFDVIAEGVETIEQADFLIRQGCELMQGFLFGRPELAMDFVKNRNRIAI
jgi:diguanylate cyclase (GGDEF)-like protein/PAS domain S-box-containing protein